MNEQCDQLIFLSIMPDGSKSNGRLIPKPARHRILQQQHAQAFNNALVNFAISNNTHLIHTTNNTEKGTCIRGYDIQT